MLSGGSCRYRKFLDSPTAMVSTALLIRLAVLAVAERNPGSTWWVVINTLDLREVGAVARSVATGGRANRVRGSRFHLAASAPVQGIRRRYDGR
jgi:hypothetical protein